MNNPDEIIDAGFEALRNARPPQTADGFGNRFLLRKKRGKWGGAALGAVAAAAMIAAFLFAMRPESALAALRQSADLSAAQPIIHIHGEAKTTWSTPQKGAWPNRPPEDTWRFPDHILRYGGHTMSELFKDGRDYTFDDRFPTGLKSSAAKPSPDSFWKFDGHIDEFLALKDTHPSVENVSVGGRPFVQYEWLRSHGPRTSEDARVFVDPQTKLIRASDDFWSGPGASTHYLSSFDYPSSAVAMAEAPHFPKGLEFQTPQQIESRFDSTIKKPDQEKVFKGVKVSLYGVVLRAVQPDGIMAIALVRGGTYWHEQKPGMLWISPPVQLAGVPLLAQTHSEQLGLQPDPKVPIYANWHRIESQNFVVERSEDLLYLAPTRLSIRIPVWGQPHGRQILGYVTFTTSKLYYDLGGPELKFLRELEE